MSNVRHRTNFADLIADQTAQHWNVRDDLKDCTLSQLQEKSQNDRLPYGVCVLNLTGDLNVGMVIRTACIMGAERVVILGRRKYDKRSTVGAQNYVDVVRVDALTDELEFDATVFDKTMAEFNYTPVFLETGGPDIIDFNWNSVPNKPCLILGNEGFGTPDYIIRDNPRVTIPQLGPLRSLNVAVAGGIAMWEIKQHLK